MVKVESHYRWNNYKNNSRSRDCNQPCIQNQKFGHYSIAAHIGFLEHDSITLIDKTDSSDSLKRRDHWRQTFCFMAPYGLKIQGIIQEFNLGISFHVNITL